MGREIRRVPKGWEHPRDESGFIPLYDEDYQTAARRWWDGAVKHHENPDRENLWFWDDEGGPPDVEHYRQSFTGEPDHFQIYETVSEGTPVSPVFATKEEMVAWMCQPIDRSSPFNRGQDWQCMQGRTRAAAEAFAEDGWAPSLVFSPSTGLVDGVEALAHKA